MIMKRDLLSRAVIIALSGVLVFLAAVFGLAMVKGMKTAKEITAMNSAIDTFTKRSKMPLTEESILFLTDERNKLKSVRGRLKLALASPLAEDVPAENVDPLQFKERLIQVQKKLKEEAKESSLSLPELLGFSKYETELLERGEILVLRKRLAVLEELVYLMTLSRVVSLDEISFMGEDLAKETAPAKPAEDAFRARDRITTDFKKNAPVPADSAAGKGARNENFCDEIRVSFKITCAYSSLIEFLYKMRVSSFIFIVDDLDVTKAKDTLDKDEAAESMIQANFLVKAEIIR